MRSASSLTTAWRLASAITSAACPQMADVVPLIRTRGASRVLMNASRRTMRRPCRCTAQWAARGRWTAWASERAVRPYSNLRPLACEAVVLPLQFPLMAGRRHQDEPASRGAYRNRLQGVLGAFGPENGNLWPKN